MDKSQNSKNQIFVDYIPAELRENQTWEVVYYIKNPVSGKLSRKRNRVKPLKSITQRRKLGKQMVSEINKKLETNHLVFFEKSGVKVFTSFNEVTTLFLNQIDVEVRDKNLSEATKETYHSKIKKIKEYIQYKKIENITCSQITNGFITKYLDYLRYTKKLGSRTRDNYYTFLVTFTKWMIDKKYLLENPCEGLKKIHKKKNEKQTIPKKIKDLIFSYYEETNPNYLVYCMCCYYCLVRRTELSKVKVKDVYLENNTLWISAEDAKNNKSDFVTIPPKLSTLLKNHIKKASPELYLFSNANYLPGKERFKPKKASSNWARMRKKLNIDPSIKWYYLKDTGIVDLIKAGVPLNSVRDQARHHSISQTNDYIPRNMKTADSNITLANLNF